MFLGFKIRKKPATSSPQVFREGMRRPVGSSVGWRSRAVHHPCRPGGWEEEAERLLADGGRIEPDFHPLECFGFARVNCLPQPGCQSRTERTG